jgi:hypothetical protein
MCLGLCIGLYLSLSLVTDESVLGFVLDFLCLSLMTDESVWGFVLDFLCLSLVTDESVWGFVLDFLCLSLVTDESVLGFVWGTLYDLALWRRRGTTREATTPRCARRTPRI